MVYCGVQAVAARCSGFAENFSFPPGLKLQTFIGELEQHEAVLAAAARCKPAHAACHVWFAAEAELVAGLRQLARQEWQLPANRCYAVPYWRKGEAEETYHGKRHAFMDENI